MGVKYTADKMMEKLWGRIGKVHGWGCVEGVEGGTSLVEYRAGIETWIGYCSVRQPASVAREDGF
jgi:hypothetical protein